MSEINEAAHDTDGVDSGRPGRPAGARPRRIVVDKRTHRIRRESEETVIIEEKGETG